jgi:hypothetical protein
MILPKSLSNSPRPIENSTSLTGHHSYYDLPASSSSQVLHPSDSLLNLEQPRSSHELSATTSHGVLRPAQELSNELSADEPTFADSHRRYRQHLRSIDNDAGTHDDRWVDRWIKPPSHFSYDSSDEVEDFTTKDLEEYKAKNDNGLHSPPSLGLLDFEVESSPFSHLSFSDIDIDINSHAKSFVMLTPSLLSDASSSQENEAQNETPTPGTGLTADNLLQLDSESPIMHVAKMLETWDWCIVPDLKLTDPSKMK